LLGRLLDKTNNR